MQLAGHLRGRAGQEWALISEQERLSLTTATSAFTSRLEPTSKVMAAQDFRHLTQCHTEPVSDFIRRLERTFNLAYGSDGMLKETRNTLLHSQLQEGLHQHLMSSPAVSGATTYKELCMAAKNEESRQSELQRRQQYQQAGNNKSPGSVVEPRQSRPPPLRTEEAQKSHQRSIGQSFTLSQPKACYTCGSTRHLAKDCKAISKESEGVCRQLGIVSYHPQVEEWKGRQKQAGTRTKNRIKVPTILVKLINSVSLLPRQDRCVEVQVEGMNGLPVLFEPHQLAEDWQDNWTAESMLIQPNETGIAQVVLTNPSEFTHRLVSEVEVQDWDSSSSLQSSVRQIASQPECRSDLTEQHQEQLADILDRDMVHTDPDQASLLKDTLSEMHYAFALEENERGDTALM